MRVIGRDAAKQGGRCVTSTSMEAAGKECILKGIQRVGPLPSLLLTVMQSQIQFQSKSHVYSRCFNSNCIILKAVFSFQAVTSTIYHLQHTYYHLISGLELLKCTFNLLLKCTFNLFYIIHIQSILYHSLSRQSVSNEIDKCSSYQFEKCHYLLLQIKKENTVLLDKMSYMSLHGIGISGLLSLSDHLVSVVQRVDNVIQQANCYIYTG